MKAVYSLSLLGVCLVPVLRHLKAGGRQFRFLFDFDVSWRKIHCDRPLRLFAETTEISSDFAACPPLPYQYADGVGFLHSLLCPMCAVSWKQALWLKPFV